MMKKITPTLSLLLFGLLLMPPGALASSMSGGSFGGQLQIINIGNDIIHFLSGPAGIVIITLGIIAGGVTIVFGRQRDQAGYRRLGQALIGGSIIVAAASLVGFFFTWELPWGSSQLFFSTPGF